jgi:hypothetical protein
MRKRGRALCSDNLSGFSSIVERFSHYWLLGVEKAQVTPVTHYLNRPKSHVLMCELIAHTLR